MTTEQFHLQWNDFEANISSAFKEIRNDKDMFDCTLSCGEKQIQAHKLVLSACSPFLKTVFRQNPHNHPLLYLKDIPFDKLKLILDFIYHGKVNVSVEDLKSFLAVAGELKIKGLTQNVSEDESKVKREKTNSPGPPSSRSELPPMEIERSPVVAPVPDLNQNNELQEAVMVVKKEQDMVSSSNGVFEGQINAGVQNRTSENNFYDKSYTVSKLAIADANSLQEMKQEIEEKFERLIVKNEVGFYCTSCNQTLSRLDSAKYHIESKHMQSGGVPCSICGFVSKTKKALWQHNKSRHRSIQKSK